MSDTQRFLLLAILIGLTAGLLVTTFHITIELVSWRVLGIPAGTRSWPIIVAPGVGAGLAALFVRYIAPSAQGSGISYTKTAIYVSDGYIPASSIAGKFTACAAAIGSGAPLGPEDPALQMGAGVASLLGRAFRLTRDHMRLIAPVGAAAGIAAAFNTPITAVLFVIEEVLSGWNAGVLGSIVLSAVSASVVTRFFLGDQPLFRVPEFALTDPSELFVYAVIGLLSGLLGALYTRGILWWRGRARTVPRAAGLALPFLAGLTVGAAAWWLPEVLGAGYTSIDSALHDEFAWPMLLTLALTKAALTALCFGAGVPGGLFAPTLFTGAMLGGGLGGLANAYWPVPTSPPSAFVLVGMGTFFAAVFRTPMTSIFMVFEVSATYVIILPVMVANTVAYLVSRALESQSLLDGVARQDGMRLPSPDEVRERRRLRVEDLMSPLPDTVSDGLPEIHPDETLDVALAALRTAPALLVITRGTPPRAVGLISRTRLIEWIGTAEHAPAAPVAPAAPIAPVAPVSGLASDLRQPPPQPDQKEPPVLEELRRLPFEGVPHELQDPARHEQHAGEPQQPRRGDSQQAEDQ
jgi:CIC family chloride channel protein